MINTSNAYKTAIKGNREFCIRDKMTFRDGSYIDLEMQDFLSYSINEATSASGKFEIGAAVIKEYTAVLNNSDGKFDTYNFEGADILAKVGIKLADGTWEILQKGTYRIVSAKASELTINIKAYDSMLYLDRPYSESALTYPASLQEIIQDACIDCGMAYDASTIDSGIYTVQERPDKDAITYRDIISYCAQVMGCYARIDHQDRLSFGWYAFDKIPGALDGGNFEGASSPYASGDNADGGNFDSYASGYKYDSGTFQDSGYFHHFYNLSSQTVNTDDITITGIMVTASSGDDAESYLYGTDDYALVISDNPLIQAGNIRQVAEHVGAKLCGSTFRPLSITIQSDPCVEAGDAAVVTDRKQRTYRTVITNTTFSIGGAQKVECSAETPTEKTYTKYGAVTKILAKMGQQAEQKLSAYDIASRQLASLMANSMGLYETYETLEDGSQIRYLHDKPVLEESQTIWKRTRDAFAVSTDGGETWNSGVDSSGNVLANVLTAIGINADWIRVGTMLADRIQGGTLILGGKNNSSGVLQVKDASGNEIVRLDLNGIRATKGTFSGNLEAAGGTFKGTLQAANGTFKGELQAATGTFGGMKAEGETITQETPVSSPGSGFYKIVISGKGIEFDTSKAKFPSDDNPSFEPNYYTDVGVDKIETHELCADTLRLSPAFLDTGGSAATVLGISSSGKIVLMPNVPKN